MYDRKILQLVLCLTGLLCFTAPVLADDTSADEKPITITITWMEDNPSERPESITIELIRTLDGVVYPMDSKTLTAANANSENSWEAVFSYYYGEVWEYSFKVTKVVPETALYPYELVETGNGTDSYHFDYIYGQGTTEMTILTHWPQGIDPPDSLNVDLYSFNDKNNAERSLLLTGEGSTWSASVSGLKDNPDNYFIVLSDLPEEYSNVVSKGENASIYINNISVNENVVVDNQETLGENNSLFNSVIPLELKKYHTVVQGVLAGMVLIALVVLCSYIIILRNKEKKEEGHEKSRD